MNLLLDCVGCVNALLRRAIGALCAAVMTALTLVVLWGVFTRYVFGEQPAFTEEFARMFLICITFFGGALAFAEGAHIGLDYLVSKFSPSCRRASALAALAASMVFVCAVLVYGGTRFVWTSMQSANMMVSAPVYLWQIYVCIPVSGVFSMMFLAESMLEILCGRSKFEPQEAAEGGELL